MEARRGGRFAKIKWVGRGSSFAKNEWVMGKETDIAGSVFKVHFVSFNSFKVHFVSLYSEF
jgi:hypothetical protein